MKRCREYLITQVADEGVEVCPTSVEFTYLEPPGEQVSTETELANSSDMTGTFRAPSTVHKPLERSHD